MEAAITDVRASRPRSWPLPLILLWMIWRRHRIGLCVVIGLLAMVSVWAHTDDANVFDPLIGFWMAAAMFKADAVPADVMVLAVLFLLVHVALLACCGYVAVAACLAMPEHGARRGSYPAVLLRAPIASTGLALWPMLFAMAAAGLIWVFGAVQILRPMGFEAPLWEPAIVLALVAGCVAAASWAPLSSEVQGALFIVVCAALVAFVVFWFHMGWLVGSIFCSVSGILLTSAAIRGFRQSRCGEIYAVASVWSDARVEVPPEIDQKRPGSMVEAVRRIEYHGSRATMAKVIFVCVSGLLLSSVLFLGGGDQKAPFETVYENFWMYALCYTFVSIFLFSACVFVQAASSSEYVRARPMATSELTVARLKSAFYCATEYVVAGLFLLVVVLGWQEVSVNHRLAPADLSQSAAGTQLVTTAAFYTVLSILSIYRLAVNIYSVGLSGNMALRILSVACDLPVVVLLFLTDFSASTDLLYKMIPWAIGLAFLKFVAGMSLILAGHKRGSLKAKGFVLAAAFWLAVAAILWIAAPLLLQSDIFSPYTTALFVFLAMPFVRLSAGPLLLDRNRHR